MESMRFAKVWAMGALLLLVLLLPACARGGSEGQSGGGGASSDQEAKQASVQLVESARSGAGQLAPNSAVGSESQGLPEGFDRKIVKSAELGIRAEAVRESAAQAQQIRRWRPPSSR
jgi:hypothetical protein